MATTFIKSFTCPHCDTKCSFFGEGTGDSVVLWCNGCGKGVYFHFQGVDLPEKYDTIIRVEPERIEDYYPRRVITIDPSIPKDIADDFNEALKCINVSAYRATVTQCRRAIQNACILTGVNSNADLTDQIDELESKRVINPGLKEIAHAVRMIGNWGAHPQRDPLREVISDDASAILEFTSEFLDEVFVRPARLKTLKTNKGLK